ncbi:UPF0149 family protein [Umboniibacter marinipuniceus]|uniref:Uncharacterized protein UPF0149 n=1 Tax=Umboniibacter marinipuniceus TaxID=569599 RepID=A0A3M0A4F4_9GAMM|nr:UPF0149 family protein [Umboniibacter marinipuniceus]RMA77668.1 uncharacterized protein UPF0149 [Umboniibacter marinipuniceus]
MAESTSLKPRELDKLVATLTPDGTFDRHQLRGYLSAVVVAPVKCPAEAWLGVLLAQVEVQELPATSSLLVSYAEQLAEQISSGTYRLPALGDAASAFEHLYSGVRQPLLQWCAGFQAGATDFNEYFRMPKNEHAAIIQESLMTLGCLAFPESVNYLAEQLALSNDDFIVHNRSRMPKALKQLHQLKTSERQTPEPLVGPDKRVSALLEAGPEEQLVLAQAIVLDNADCAEAWEILARLKSESVTQTIQCLEQAVRAAEHTLGREYLEFYRGQLWDQAPARVLIQSLVGLGASYKKDKQLKKAASYFEKALVLDRSDVVAARAALMTIYFELGNYDAVANILSRYDEQNAWVVYSRALLNYVRSGDTEASRFLREQAKLLNPHVPALMSQRKEAPANPRLDHSVGSVDEAAFYVSDAKNAWRKVIGSIVWLVDG